MSRCDHCQASRDCETANSNSGVAVPAPVKLKANAPQAIIIEVLSLLCCSLLIVLLCLCFVVAFSRVGRTDLQRNQQLQEISGRSTYSNDACGRWHPNQRAAKRSSERGHINLTIV